MKIKAKILPISELVAHERVSKKRVHELIESLRKDKVLKEPIIVAKDYQIVLDGHHRVAALKMLGARYISGYVIDYLSKDISVTIRRKELMENLIKETVVTYAKQGMQFPYKTTKHTIHLVKEKLELPLASCK